MAAATTLEQAMAELKRHFATSAANGATVQYTTLAEITNFLYSCGIDVPQEEHHQLVHLLRQEGYKESRADNALQFHLYS